MSDESLRDSIQAMHEIFKAAFDAIYADAMDEDKIEDWDDFYSFLGRGVEIFLNQAVVDRERMLLYILLTKMITFAYFYAKQNQPNADFAIFRYVFANRLDFEFAEMHKLITQFGNLSEEERNEWTDKAECITSSD